MNSKKAFLTYWGLHLHFTTTNYSVIDYGINTKASEAKWEKMPQGSRYRFEWLANKYQITQDLLYACIGAQFEDVDIRFEDTKTIHAAYLKFKQRRESLTYTIKQELPLYYELKDKSLFNVMFMYFVGELSPETTLLIYNGTESIQLAHDDSTLAYNRPKTLKLLKYKSFFSTKKYLHLLSSQP